MAKTATPAEPQNVGDQVLWANGSVPVHQLTAFELYLAMQHINKLIWIALMLSRATNGDAIVKVGIKAHTALDMIFAGRQVELQPPSPPPPTEVKSN